MTDFIMLASFSRDEMVAALVDTPEQAGYVISRTLAGIRPGTAVFDEFVDGLENVDEFAEQLRNLAERLGVE